MKVKISTSKPPSWIYDECVKKFGINFSNTIFAVDDTIHTAKPYLITPDLEEHELTHIKQQKRYGWEKWWRDYLNDDQFRLSQELEAYYKQYQYLQNNYPRHIRKERQKQIIKTLSGKQYGNLVTEEQAKELLLKQYEKEM